jgi:hypothetical protein
MNGDDAGRTQNPRYLEQDFPRENQFIFRREESQQDETCRSFRFDEGSDENVCV